MLFHDLRYALRTLLRSPGYAAAAVLTLALGIAANTAVFTWFKAAYLDPIPGARDVQQLVYLSNSNDQGGGYSMSYPELLFLRQNSKVFSSLSAFDLLSVNLNSTQEPEQVWGGIVSANIFDTVAATPAAGRLFQPDEDSTPNGNPVAVLGYSLWQRKFNRDPGIVGRQIKLNGHSYTVIGVAPQGFVGVYGGLAQELFVPISMAPQLVRGKDLLNGPSWLQMIARMRPGVTLAQVQADLHVLAPQFEATQTKKRAQFNIRAYTAAHSPRGMVGFISDMVPLLMGVTGLLMLIVCSNVASLMLARASGRTREFAVRAALGAKRTQLVQQLLIEGTVVALIAGALGIVVSFGSSTALAALVPPLGVPTAFNAGVDARTLLFALALALVSALVFALAPAFSAARVNIATALKDAAAAVGGGAGRQRMRNVFVMTQIALSFIALVCAGLTVRTLQRALAVDPGFKVNNVLLSSLDLYLGGYDEARGAAFYRDLLQRTRALPGVTSASLTSYVPMGLWGGSNSQDIEVSGYNAKQNESMDAVTDFTGPNYLATMGIPLVAGRDFSDTDSATSPQVVIVNAAFAKHFWPGEQAVGKSVRVDKTWRTVVGVARDINYRYVDNSGADPSLYVPAFQRYTPGLTIVLRTTGDPYALVPALRGAVRELDGSLPLTNVESLRHHTKGVYFNQQTPATALSALGAIALALAAIGLYGLVVGSPGTELEFAL